MMRVEERYVCRTTDLNPGTQQLADGTPRYVVVANTDGHDDYWLVERVPVVESKASDFIGNEDYASVPEVKINWHREDDDTEQGSLLERARAAALRPSTRAERRAIALLQHSATALPVLPSYAGDLLNDEVSRGGEWSIDVHDGMCTARRDDGFTVSYRQADAGAFVKAFGLPNDGKPTAREFTDWSESQDKIIVPPRLPGESLVIDLAGGIRPEFREAYARAITRRVWWRAWWWPWRAWQAIKSHTPRRRRIRRDVARSMARKSPTVRRWTHNEAKARTRLPKTAKRITGRACVNATGDYGKPTKMKSSDDASEAITSVAQAVKALCVPMRPGETCAGNVAFFPRDVARIDAGTQRVTLRRVACKLPPVGAMVQLVCNGVSFAFARVVACVVFDRMTLCEDDARHIGCSSLEQLNSEISEVYGRDTRWLVWLQFVVMEGM